MSIAEQRGQGAPFTTRQKCHLAFGSVQPDQKLHACTGATRERRRLNAPSRHKEREAKVGSGTRECSQGHNHHALIEVNGWGGRPCCCEKCVE